MRNGTFDFSALKKSYLKLGEIIIRYAQSPSDDALRDSLIQRFEFTYSVALKTIRKYFIEKAFVIEDVNNMSFNDMVRTANQLNIIKSDLSIWTNFREMRNLTSHTYDEVIAQKVADIIPSFYEEITFLLNGLSDNNG